MYTPDEKTDELLNGYLDGYLSAAEKQELERALAASQSLRAYLNILQETQAVLQKSLRSPSAARRSERSDAERVDRIISLSRERALSDPLHANATWVLPEKSNSVLPIPLHPINGALNRGWIWAIAGMAASLIFVAGSLIQNRLAIEPLASQQGLIAQVDNSSEASQASSNRVDPVIPIQLADQKSINPPVTPSHSNTEPLSTARTEESLAKVEPKREISKDLAMDLNVESNSSPSLPIEPSQTGSFVNPKIQPNAGQTRKLEQSLKGTLNLTYLMVIDISLRDRDEAREYLDQIFTRFDIPSAVELNVQASTLKRLADSRLIASGQVALPNLAPKKKEKNTEPSPEDRDAQSAELVFVKARGERLDAAIIEMMQSVEMFPEFSMDLAFDAPIQNLAAELRFIQEASLPNDAPIARSSIASMLSMRGSSGESVARFPARPRRGAPLAMERRINGKVPQGLGAELMNPIAHALIILRDPE